MNLLFIDIRTVFLSYTIINIINLFLIGLLCLQIRKRYSGTLAILLSFVMVALGNTLLFFQNFFPEWISIVIGNTLVISSTFLLLIGLEQFVHKKGVHIYNFLFIIIFILIHSYFTYFKPDANKRVLNLSIFYVLISAQIAWLTLVRVSTVVRKTTLGVGLVFCTLLVVQIVHIIVIMLEQYQATYYFNLNNSEGLFLVTYEVILIILTFSIFIMYNKKLIIDIKKQEKNNKILGLKKSQLELELKKKELFQKELYIASMKEVNKNILKELGDNLNRSSDISNANIHKITGKLKNFTQKSKIWKEFDIRFKESNSIFYKTLLKDYPSLTSNEIRVTCLIHQNYNTKEIAEILQRSTKTIENIRVLIRRKMKLQKNENLTLFLKSIK